jgi:hypothetical protein
VSPEGTIEGVVGERRFGGSSAVPAGLELRRTKPGIETPGYCHLSLRDTPASSDPARITKHSLPPKECEQREASQGGNDFDRLTKIGKTEIRKLGTGLDQKRVNATQVFWLRILLATHKGIQMRLWYISPPQVLVPSESNLPISQELLP